MERAMRDVVNPQVEPIVRHQGFAPARSILVTEAEPSEIRRDTH
jgi:hypothetical protein